MFEISRVLFGSASVRALLGISGLIAALVLAGCGQGGQAARLAGAASAAQLQSSNQGAQPAGIGDPSSHGAERLPTTGDVQPAESGVKPLQATILSPVTVGPGAFRIAVPQGWTVNTPQGTSAAVITPAGQKQPSIVILPMLPVSDLRFTTAITSCTGQGFSPFGDVISQCVIPAIQMQLADSSRPWTPDAALRLLLQALAQGGSPFGTPTITPLSSDTARFEVSTMANGQPLIEVGVIQMLYLQNPLLGQAPGQAGVSSFAFISACSASPQQVEQQQPICASVLRSFTPSEAWLNALAQQALDRYRQEFNLLLQMGQSAVTNSGLRGMMISQWGAAMQTMQVQAYQNIQATSYRTGENWIAALGNNVNLQDPNTGQVYAAPGGYRTYCLTASGAVLGSNGSLAAGDGPVNDQCQTILKGW